jgi:hypothetical protein
LAFVRNHNLKSNLAYTLLLSDVIYWLLMRTDVYGMAREMLVKLFVFIGGTLIESITKDYLKGSCGKGYKDRSKYLADAGIIDEELKAELDWVWDARNNMHLFLLEESEYVNEYNSMAHTRCVAAFKRLVAALTVTGPLPVASSAG